MINYLLLPARFIICVIVGLTMTQTFAKWEKVTHLKQQYIKASQIPKYYKEYDFKKTVGRGGKLVLTAANKKTVMEFAVSSQEVFLNGIKFHFSYPVIYKDGSYLISQVDLSKLLHPILRPSLINKERPFRTVILDPGHGGKDSGTVNDYGFEKTYTLSLAKKIKQRLESKGFLVALTRYSDKYLSLQERVDIANQFKDAIFVSLHFNAGGAGHAQGIETFTLSPPGVTHYGRGLKASDFRERQGNSKDTANIALATAIHGRVIRATKARDRGIRRARYTVLSGVKHPALLFEGGFMSNQREALLINNDEYLNLLSQAIYEGVILYKTATEKGMGNR